MPNLIRPTGQVRVLTRLEMESSPHIQAHQPPITSAPRQSPLDAFERARLHSKNKAQAAGPGAGMGAVQTGPRDPRDAVSGGNVPNSGDVVSPSPAASDVGAGWEGLSSEGEGLGIEGEGFGEDSRGVLKQVRSSRLLSPSHRQPAGASPHSAPFSTLFHLFQAFSTHLNPVHGHAHKRHTSPTQMATHPFTHTHPPSPPPPRLHRC